MLLNAYVQTLWYIPARAQGIALKKQARRDQTRVQTRYERILEDLSYSRRDVSAAHFPRTVFKAT